MRRMLLLGLLVLLVACGDTPPPPPDVISTPEPPTTLVIHELLLQPAQWSGRPLTLIAALEPGRPRVLIAGLDASGAPLGGENPERAIWLAADLPADLPARFPADLAYLKLRGRLSPPGGYGTDGRYPYQFSADSVSPLEPETTTLPLVAENVHALDGALLQLEGVLLIGADGALMVDQVGGGGVPPPNARQVKIRHLAAEQSRADLERGGAVRYGRTTIVGWLNDGLLVPFVLR